MVNTDDGPAKDAWLAAGWAERRAVEQLFDLVLDPGEGENLVDRDEHARWSRTARAAAPVDGRDRRPLLDGPVEPAPGAEYNEPDQISTSEPTRTAPVIGRAARERGGS